MKKRESTIKWLSNLKPGKYSLTELAILSGKQKNSICRTMNLLKTKKEYVQHPDFPYLKEAVYFINMN